MGGSGGGQFGGYTPGQIRAWIEEEQRNVDIASHEASINGQLADLLIQYNDRDVSLVRNRLQEIQTALESSLETAIELRFGGSVAKHTYVDGLSDVDALAILQDSETKDQTAGEVLDDFASTLGRLLGYEVNVSEGQLAVTITYPDEMAIQILPAVRTPEGVRIPNASGDTWSPVIRPDAFAAKLTEVNQLNNGQLIPVIKLAKAALSDLPDNIRPSGYHMESLAVEAFKNYAGPKTYKAMLHHFLDASSDLVLSPIRDRTGQSLHVDLELGDPNSRPRRTLSGIMYRIAKRMESADRAGATDDWLRAIGE